MTLEAQKVEWSILKSELEAVLTEAELIRSYQPPVNILLKDDKSPLYILITAEEFPRVLTVRKQELQKNRFKGHSFGPFQSAYKVKEVLRIVRPIFPWCNAPRIKNHQQRACFYHHLKLCPGVCTQSISAKAYQKQIDDLALFLRGKSKEVQQKIKIEMQELSLQQLYEEAAIKRDQLNLIKEVTDVKYKLKPDVVQNHNLVGSGDKHALILLAKLLSDYQNFPLTKSLSRIEAYDVSNIQGRQSAVSMVVFNQERLDSSAYKAFHIRSLETPNDFLMLQEALIRRQNHPEWGLPDLIIIDGGKGQVRAVLKILRWNIPILGITKNPDRLTVPIIQWQMDENKQAHIDHKNIKWHVEKINQDSSLGRLVLPLRDEAHRFANVHRKKRMTKEWFSTKK